MKKPFEQIDGVTMDGNFGLLLQNVLRNCIEKRLQQRITKLPFYCRYVEVILLFCDNDLHLNLHLTSEQESFDFISFLDILIARQKNLFIKLLSTHHLH